MAEVWNKAVVDNGPTARTTFTLSSPTLVSNVTTYHWNQGRGTAPGTITLLGSDGRVYGGPWRTRATPGSFGAQNVNWVAEPMAYLPAGTYTVIDSEPSTWSHNAQSQGMGFVMVYGQSPLPTQGLPTNTVQPPTTPPAGAQGMLSQEITGTWSSDYGKVVFSGTNAALTGSWDQGGGSIGRITGGSYNPATRRLTFTYYQSWNNQDGRTEFTLSNPGGVLTLKGTWRQWTHGSPEPANAHSGSWTMTRQ